MCIHFWYVECKWDRQVEILSGQVGVKTPGRWIQAGDVDLAVIYIRVIDDVKGDEWAFDRGEKKKGEEPEKFTVYHKIRWSLTGKRQCPQSQWMRNDRRPLDLCPLRVSETLYYNYSSYKKGWCVCVLVLALPLIGCFMQVANITRLQLCL